MISSRPNGIKSTGILKTHLPQIHGSHLSFLARVYSKKPSKHNKKSRRVPQIFVHIYQGQKKLVSRSLRSTTFTRYSIPIPIPSLSTSSPPSTSEVSYPLSVHPKLRIEVVDQDPYHSLDIDDWRWQTSLGLTPKTN